MPCSSCATTKPARLSGRDKKAYDAPLLSIKEFHVCLFSPKSLILLSLWACAGDGSGASDGTNTESSDGTDSDSNAVDLDADDDADGYTIGDGDCDDNNANAYPGARETCDGSDNDCDDLVDEGTLTTYYADQDGDGYGDPTAWVYFCEPTEGYSSQFGDCDDDDSSVNPAAEEVWYDGWDRNCDENSDYDQDGDGYVVASLDDPNAPTYDPGTGEPVEEGESTADGDCDDENADIHPSADEHCDDVDEDCDGAVDDDATDAGTWYVDADGDGYGEDATALAACESPGSSYHLGEGGDCDGADPALNPDASDRCDEADGIDNDCDDIVDECCYDGTLRFDYDVWHGDVVTWDCFVSYTGEWCPTTPPCADCEYGFTAVYALSRGGVGCPGWVPGLDGAPFEWTLGVDINSDGSAIIRDFDGSLYYDFYGSLDSDWLNFSAGYVDETTYTYVRMSTPDPSTTPDNLAAA